MTREIFLGGVNAAGRVALVDDEDYALVSQRNWHAWECRRKGRIIGPYASTGINRDGKLTTLYMHVLLTGWPETDHRDRNGLNNQRANLRRATHQQNVCHQIPQANRLSKYKGVTLDLTRGVPLWRARITIDGKTRCLGRYSSEDDAARAYDAAALAAWGEFAYLNLGGGESE